MKINDFVRILNSDFYTGVPDSQLKELCNYLINTYGTDTAHHIIAANEGNCTAIAAGYHLATGKIPVVYMQNSGEGNIINPAASLLNDEVYAIPMIFVIGWRGEPGVHDEPQHIYQGKVTLKLLEDMDIASFIIGKDTAEDDIARKMQEWKPLFDAGKQAAFVVRKGALEYNENVDYSNSYEMKREDIIRHIVSVSGNDLIVSTTGKASRELFEMRGSRGEGHEKDFLTVGSMGHSSSIALGIALQKPDRKIWVIDGDGAALMHMGSMAVIGAAAPPNIIHIVINNGAHETVGGMPTAASRIDLVGIAKACGYEYTASVSDPETLDKVLKEAKETGKLCFVEVKCSVGARSDLGRPTTTPVQNKKSFMDFISENG